ncbi:MAG TPA: anhydro-N-acetylmuramic acid kinase, partial [Saprospiraceae bacterium]|nr:anhydro-N-acetylmuramic acid kinase [Saprospiraceae bacterium]
MNDIEKLYGIAQKESRIIIGLMSGTSVDGLDMALCKFSGFGLETQFKLLHFRSVEFPQNLRQQILNFLGKRNVDLLELTLLNTEFAIFTASAILDFLNQIDFPTADVDLISSHGQTIFHAPKSFHKYLDRPNATLQIGDGDHIAAITGIITVHDLRQKHVAKGGEGAPLALYGDYILYASEVENRALLNIGGISNFTFISKDKSQACWATDVGPGNTIIDELCRKYFQLNFDNE